MSNLVISNTSLNSAATNGDSSMTGLLTNNVNHFSNSNSTDIQNQTLMMNGNVMNNGYDQQQQQQQGQINQQAAPPPQQQQQQNVVPNFDFDFLNMNDNMALDKK